ncbi:type II toxin-antitoxin system PemK/MazF family toxin [Lachnospiraceae bacterium]|nr:type II toxin-antitoxin system PemK/MazF family toxin [Lachnospiraceae bacterium]
MDFSPQRGHEQKGRRPAIVLSNNILNQHSSIALVCPITNTNKNHPFHIELDERTQTTGVILCDQAKMLDIKARNAEFKEECPEDIWNEAKDLIISFM